MHTYSSYHLRKRNYIFIILLSEPSKAEFAIISIIGRITYQQILHITIISYSTITFSVYGERDM
jgi:hypothetical protein